MRSSSNELKTNFNPVGLIYYFVSIGVVYAVISMTDSSTLHLIFVFWFSIMTKQAIDASLYKKYNEKFSCLEKECEEQEVKIKYLEDKIKELSKTIVN